MNIGELIGALQEMADAYGEETKVRVAIQPSWPLAERISNISVLEDNEDYEGPVMWIATEPVPSYEHPYAPRGAWDGWYQ